jgi:hypothetical protein
MLLPMRSTSSEAVVTPDLSISSRVIVCTGDTPSDSVRGMFDPVIVTRGVCSCCAHADPSVSAEAIPAANAIDIDAATGLRAFFVFIFLSPKSQMKQPVAHCSAAHAHWFSLPQCNFACRDATCVPHGFASEYAFLVHHVARAGI